MGGAGKSFLVKLSVKPDQVIIINESGLAEHPEDYGAAFQGNLFFFS